jgi:hypothetical protein
MTVPYVGNLMYIFHLVFAALRCMFNPSARGVVMCTHTVFIIKCSFHYVLCDYNKIITQFMKDFV